MAKVNVKLHGCQSYSLGGKYKYKKGQVATLDSEKDVKALAQLKASKQFSVAEVKEAAKKEPASDKKTAPAQSKKKKSK